MFLYVYIAEVEQLFSCREVIINCHLNIFLEHVLKRKLTYILNCNKSQSKTSLFSNCHCTKNGVFHYGFLQ